MGDSGRTGSKAELTEEEERTVTKKRWDGIDLLKCIAILMVIALHVPLLHFYMDGVEGSLFRKIQYGLRIIMQPVPYFVAVNGFLMLKKERFDLNTHIRKTLTMIVLFFVWASILVIFARLIAGEGLTLKQFLCYVFETGDGTGNYAGVLWFMEGLIGVYLIFPLLWRTFQEDYRSFRFFFVSLSILMIGVSCLELLRDALRFHTDTEVLDQFIGLCKRFRTESGGWFLFYFCLGGVIAHDLDCFHEKRTRMVLAGLAAWALSYGFAYYMSSQQGSMYDPSFNYESAFTAVFIVAIFALVLPYEASGRPISRMLMEIGKNTFGIFVIHKIFIWIIEKYFDVFSFGERVATCVAVTAASYFLTVLMKKIPGLRKLVMM